jgi:cytochrome P450
VRVVESAESAIERDARGVWHVRDFDLARAVLRSTSTKQAGFKAEIIEKVPGMMTNPPILYMEGKEHLEQRKQTARYFTPAATSKNYRQFMTDLAETLVEDVKRQRQADLSKVTMTLAVNVAARVVGLTDSRLPDMDQRLDAFFAEGVGEFKRTPRGIFDFLVGQWNVLAFLYLDVKPAIAARKRQPQDDVISHLVGLNRNDREILTECITYGAAGMVTTREFICAAAWHMLDHPDLRNRYLVAGEEERYTILHEILRLEPVAGHLFRRAVSDLHLVHAGETITIPAGDLVNVHITAANIDADVVGERPQEVCPGRELQGDRVPEMMLSFGDGHHRCPGAYVAIQESDIFLQRLLAIDGLHIVSGPELSFSDLTGGYELRKFMVAC